MGTSGGTTPWRGVVPGATSTSLEILKKRLDSCRQTLYVALLAFGQTLFEILGRCDGRGLLLTEQYLRVEKTCCKAHGLEVPMLPTFQDNLEWWGTTFPNCSRPS